MNVLEKILEEINEKIKFAERMMVEKPCDKLDEIANDTAQSFISAYEGCSEIISSHMDEIQKCGECSRRQQYMRGYEDGKKDNDWIPVEEKLPEADGFYLATLDGEICGQEEAFAGLAEFEHGKWIDDEENYKCVLAWQPLPEPYKEGRER